MFCHEEVAAGRDESAVYIEQVGIQRMVDVSEMFTESLKDDLTSFFLILQSKLSNGQICRYSSRLLAISCIASRMTRTTSIVSISSEKENCLLDDVPTRYAAPPAVRVR